MLTQMMTLLLHLFTSQTLPQAPHLPMIVTILTPLSPQIITVTWSLLLGNLPVNLAAQSQWRLKYSLWTIMKCLRH
jgi:hypothetical protein